MKVRLPLGLACALGTTLVSATPALAVDPVVVVATDRPESGPAASTTYLAWTVISGDFQNVRAQAIGSDTSFRVNPKGRNAVTGGIDGSTLVYELFLPDYESSDLALIDLSTRTNLDVPDGVNTDAWEYSPSISGTHLLFGRGIPHGGSIVLFDISTGTSQVLFSKTNTHRRFVSIGPGQVNGNYAVWSQVVTRRKDRRIGDGIIGGDVWLYDIATETTTKLPSAKGVWQSSPSVDSAGTVYFRRRSTFFSSCGHHTSLVARQIDGTESLLYTFPGGSDFFFPVAVDNANGTTDVYVDGLNCEGDPDFSDIWMFPGV